MATITAMGLSQISGPTHWVGQMMESVFCLGLEVGDLRVGEVRITLLSRTNHFQVSFRRSEPKLSEEKGSQ